METVSNLFSKGDKTEKHAFTERLRGLGLDVDTQCNMLSVVDSVVLVQTKLKIFGRNFSAMKARFLLDQTSSAVAAQACVAALSAERLKYNLKCALHI